MSGCTSAPHQTHPRHAGLRRILAIGLDGQSAQDILAVPDDFYTDLGLAALISPLRLHGMSAMLARIKRRLRAEYAPSPRRCSRPHGQPVIGERLVILRPARSVYVICLHAPVSTSAIRHARTREPDAARREHRH